MTKKEQIKDMLTIRSKDCGNCEYCSYKSDDTFDCTEHFYAQELYNAGYRKVPDGAVVLTREEYETLRMYIYSSTKVDIERIISNIRKE